MAFEAPETGPWLRKYYSINEDWVADDRRKLLAFARDLLNSDYAGHRLTFQLFAQSPPFAHLAAVYRNFDWDDPLHFVKQSAGLSEGVMRGVKPGEGDGAVVLPGGGPRGWSEDLANALQRACPLSSWRRLRRADSQL